MPGRLKTMISPKRRNKRRLAWLLPLLVLLLPGCRTDDMFPDDLALARQARLERDWPRAERMAERFLREERDAEKRWEAWNVLLEAINGASQEPRASLECLESMLAEYEGDHRRLPQILSEMARYSQILRRYDNAANAWSAYTDLPELEPSDMVNGYRQLARAQYAQRHFEAADETLQQCLALPLPDHDKIWCMLDLADADMGRQQWSNVAGLCQQILDSEPDREVAGLAGYYMGDALEQMGKYAEALRQFEEARDAYPNPAVMDNRIEYLKKQLKAKK